MGLATIWHNLRQDWPPQKIKGLVTIRHDLQENWCRQKILLRKPSFRNRCELSGLLQLLAKRSEMLTIIWCCCSVKLSFGVMSPSEIVNTSAVHLYHGQLLGVSSSCAARQGFQPLSNLCAASDNVDSAKCNLNCTSGAGSRQELCSSNTELSEVKVRLTHVWYVSPFLWNLLVQHLMARTATRTLYAGHIQATEQQGTV